MKNIRLLRKNLHTIFVISLTVMCCSALLAEVPARQRVLEDGEFQIKDFSGKPRLVGKQGDNSSYVDCLIEDSAGAKADNLDVTLRNAEDDIEFTRKTLDGLVRFEGLQEGTWQLGSVTPGLVLKDIKIVQASNTSVRELAEGPSRAVQKRFEISPVTAGAGVLATGIGIVAIADATDSSGSKRDTEVLPTPLSPSN